MANEELFIIHDPEWAESYPDDAFLIESLKRHVAITIANWQNISPEMLRNKRVLIRHPYNYVETPKAFLTWLQDVNSKAKKIVNRSLLISKYMNKQYLVDLQDSGIPVVPTISLASQRGIDQVMQQNWKEILMKPLLGEASKGIKKMQKGELAVGPYLAQKYIQSILLGEISIVVLDNIVSHSIIRNIKNIEEFTMDWQDCHLYYPPPELLGQVQKVLSSDDFSGCYMRLDWIQDGRQFLLSEIELVDPVLFLGSLENDQLWEVSKELLKIVMK